MWLQYSVAVATIFGAVFGGWGIYIVLTSQTSQQNPTLSTSETGTSTIRLSDIFARYNAMNRAIDQQIFLKDYVGVNVYGMGSFNNLAEALGEEGTYYLYLNTPGALIMCEFDNTDEVTKRRLDLLTSGNKVDFFGTFTGSISIGGDSWSIRNCSFAN